MTTYLIRENVSPMNYELINIVLHHKNNNYMKGIQCAKNVIFFSNVIF